MILTRKTALLLTATALWTACGRTLHPDRAVRDLSEIRTDDTLRVLTLYSSASYFLYRGEEMGYEHDLISQFAEANGLTVKTTVAENEAKLIEKLLEGEGDIIAYNLPWSKALQDRLAFCGTERITHQVLVQRRTGPIPPIRDVTQLVGKEVYVEKGSKYEERLRHLNDELGGGIHIQYVARDTLTTEDLIDMVASGEIDYTLADDNIAKLNKTYNRQLDVRLEVSFPQRSSWAVRKETPLLQTALRDWLKAVNDSPSYKGLLKRYFEASRRPPAAPILSPQKGQISHYDALFKKYAPKLEWDWRLLAAQAYLESRFDTAATSWAGAQGLMQLMPRTARQYGLEERELRNPEKNIAAATENLLALDRIFAGIENREERIKFVLAAYNAGVGHILDAVALAEKYGRNPQVWDGEVEHSLLWKSNPEYFNDPVCKFGYLRGKETYNYVKDVLNCYGVYKAKIKG